MEARASSPRADRNCTIRDQRNKEKSDRQPNTNQPDSFHILKVARAPTTARAHLLIITSSNVAESAPIIILVVVVDVVSLSIPNRPIAGYIWSYVIVVICRKSRTLKSDFYKAPLIDSCSEDKLPHRSFGEQF